MNANLYGVPTYIPETADEQLDDLLVRICEKLQLSESMHDMAVQRYNSVGKWLAAEGSILLPYSPQIYAQGSLSIGTTVRPMKYQEFDVDLVCEMNIDYDRSDPIAVLNTIEKRLKENGNYKGMVERKNRCLRLNYENEFHMDILPGAPKKFQDNGKLKVPDREMREWKDSNPKGHVKWFTDKVNLCLTAFMEKALRANVEPAPDYEPLKRKLPLKRTVQLMKRYRDICFKDDEASAPISIVLTTLAGEEYYGEPSVNSALGTILGAIIHRIPLYGRLIVLNPTNQDEDLSEKWDQDYDAYIKFISWVEEFQQQWLELNFKRGKGIHKIASHVGQMFGVEVTSEALEEQARIIQAARAGNSVGITPKTGLLSSMVQPGVIPIKKNTFYGA